MWRIVRDKTGEVSLLVVLGLIVFMGASAYLTTNLNQNAQTTQTRASGNCKSSCSVGKDTWINECKTKHNVDRASECDGWYDGDCGGCGSGGEDKPTATPKPEGGGALPTPTPVSGGGDNTPFDPGATANNPDIQNLCGANPNDSRCCKINEWKNANQGASLPGCGGGSGGNPSPTPGSQLSPGAGGAGSCNNGQIPNGHWACFSKTKVIQCNNGSYTNESPCTSCTGISADKGSICQGGVNTPTPDPRGTCNPRFEIWCPTQSKCTSWDKCPTPTPGNGCGPAGFVKCATQNNTCMPAHACPTPTQAPAKRKLGEKCGSNSECESDWCNVHRQKCIDGSMPNAEKNCGADEEWCTLRGSCSGDAGCCTKKGACLEPTSTPQQNLWYGGTYTPTPKPACSSPNKPCARKNGECIHPKTCSNLPTPTPQPVPVPETATFKVEQCDHMMLDAIVAVLGEEATQNLLGCVVTK